MIRRIGALAVIVVAASVLGAAPAAAQDTEPSDGPAHTVRIQARKLESGKVEFGLQLDGDREWLPRARRFPYATAPVGKWLFASPYTMRDGTSVKIQARRLANGKLEFGLQLDGDQVWLPRSRYFPYETVEVDRWLFASRFSLFDEIGLPASAPRNLRVTAVLCDIAQGPHSVRLAWDRPASSGGTRITAYEITRLRAAEGGFKPEIADPDLDEFVPGTSHTDTDVRTAELYRWSVRALNRAGRGAAAAVELIFKPHYMRGDHPWGDRQQDDCDEFATPLPGATTAGPPRNMQAALSSDGTKIVLSWSPPADDGGDRITSYELGRSAIGAPSPVWGPFPILRRHYRTEESLGGITSGEFTYWVRAVNSHGWGPWTTVNISF